MNMSEFVDDIEFYLYISGYSKGYNTSSVPASLHATMFISYSGCLIHDLYTSKYE